MYAWYLRRPSARDADIRRSARGAAGAATWRFGARGDDDGENDESSMIFAASDCWRRPLEGRRQSRDARAGFRPASLRVRLGGGLLLLLSFGGARLARDLLLEDDRLAAELLDLLLLRLRELALRLLLDAPREEFQRRRLLVRPRLAAGVRACAGSRGPSPRRRRRRPPGVRRAVERRARLPRRCRGGAAGAAGRPMPAISFASSGPGRRAPSPRPRRVRRPNVPRGCARRGFPGSPWPSFFGPLAKRRPRASFFALSVAGAGAAAATLADMLL